MWTVQILNSDDYENIDYIKKKLYTDLLAADLFGHLRLVISKLHRKYPSICRIMRYYQLPNTETDKISHSRLIRKITENTNLDSDPGLYSTGFCALPNIPVKSCNYLYTNE